jgi:hypothetical protein
MSFIYLAVAGVADEGPLRASDAERAYGDGGGCSGPPFPPGYDSA